MAGSELDMETLRRWVGRRQEDEDVISARQARLMAATVGCAEPSRFVTGVALPALWHWIYFLEGLPAKELGRDGHPARGGFLPPVPLSNRMWAGGRIEMPQPIVIGSTVRRRSSVLRVEHKQGRRGDLVFVTVLHELLSQDDTLLLREEHDIVYTSQTTRTTSANAAVRHADAAPACLAGPRVVPDTVMLFRYSALTFNGHRIHYDADYCRRVEGYDDLVIHGPLNATLLANHAEAMSGRRLQRFEYRLLAPAILGATLTVSASAATDGLITLAMQLDDGTPCAEAVATPSPAETMP